MNNISCSWCCSKNLDTLGRGVRETRVVHLQLKIPISNIDAYDWIQQSSYSSVCNKTKNMRHHHHKNNLQKVSSKHSGVFESVFCSIISACFRK